MGRELDKGRVTVGASENDHFAKEGPWWPVLISENMFIVSLFYGLRHVSASEVFSRTSAIIMWTCQLQLVLLFFTWVRFTSKVNKLWIVILCCVKEAIDVKKRFLRFLLIFLTFLFFGTFFIFNWWFFLNLTKPAKILLNLLNSCIKPLLSDGSYENSFMNSRSPQTLSCILRQ